jgi:hypothetical protein
MIGTAAGLPEFEPVHERARGFKCLGGLLGEVEAILVYVTEVLRENLLMLAEAIVRACALQVGGKLQLRVRQPFSVGQSQGCVPKGQ